ncbi:LysR family transcriptional regulator [Methylotenera versatilis]|uniref:LysR family transcriptional regulator n=1 Tax=Methylotenera versatilis TaxID=1055487 RepID=UPI000648AF6F|nr:LysR family transcriptional regulator [Methylotenera versatilis]
MDRLNAMGVFVRVAELASFTKAADSLGVPKGSISTTIQNLESHMRTRLLHRTTRTVSLTQDGQIFYERCKDLLVDVDELETMFQSGKTNITGHIRVDMPIAVAKNLVIPNLTRFLSEYPNIEIELSSTDRRVDVIAEGFDCVVRVGALSDSGLIARSLGQLRIINCASAAYLQGHGEPTHIDELANHFIIHYATVLGAKSASWEYFDGEKYASLKMKSLITVNSSDAYMAACVAGLGIIQLPVAGKHYPEANGLVEILKNYKAEPMPVSMLYPNRRHQSKRVKIFMDWVAELMKDYTQ